MTNISERALLERALIAMEEVMARMDASEIAGVPPGTPAHEAATMCLTSAVALVDVAQSLLRRPGDEQADALLTEWQAVIGHTKKASRTAHQAVLLLAAQRNLPMAQGGITVATASQG